MKYLSLCSGIEAATVAWHPLGWEAVAYSEIERFPSEVLAHHYPNTPNLGDMTKFKEWTNVSNVDLLVGGTPCQSFSVAGLRKGLDDPRGNLMLTYLAIAKQHRPNWLVWENVPGVLSSNGGRDFGSFLGGLAECGYGFAYRVLDAQYFGVAQRRRRVFVVGYLGDWRLAAAVLFERHSLQGHPAPSREKRQGASIHAGKGIAECSPTIRCELAKQVNNQIIGNAEAFFIPDTPMQPVFSLQGAGYTSQNSQGSGWNEEVSFTLNSFDVHGVAQAISYDMKQHHNPQPSNTVQLTTKNCIGVRGDTPLIQPMAYNISPGKGALKEDIHVTDADATKTLDASASNPAMHQGGTAIVQPIGVDTYNGTETGQVSCTITADVGGPTHSGPKVMQSMAVRRLTPVECERLQGFGDNYTDIKSKGKPTPDGPRYKALGNSMAVPVMAWIGQRIEQVEALCQHKK
jgi:DNA (cytosine-5)-methyltransferase 1